MAMISIKGLFFCKIFQIGMFLNFLFFSNLSGAHLPLTVSAKYAILINGETGKILYSKQPDIKTPPASTTKIATALLSLQKISSFEEVVKCPLECLIKIPKKLKIENKYQDPPYRLEPDGSTYGILAGEKLTVNDLLHGMMLCSGNDASNVLAYHFSEGNIDKFMEEMNEYLKKIGCHHTKFYNPHGLHFPTHMTTARDLAILAKEAIKNEQFLSIVSTCSYERPKTNKQGSKIIATTNRLLKKGPFYYPKAFGIKSGYHENAGYNFVGAAKDETRTLISVVLQCPTVADAYKDTIKMFDAAFFEKKLSRILLNAEETIFTHSIKESKKLIQAVIMDDVVIDYFPSEEEALLPVLEWGQIKLPIKKKDIVGTLYVKNRLGKIVAKKEIFSLVSIKEPLIKRVLKSTKCVQASTLMVVFILSLLTMALFKKRKAFQDPKIDQSNL